MSEMTILTVEEPYVAVGGVLLEGPSYDARNDRLQWVDIGTHEIHTVKLSEGPQSLQRFALNGNTVATLANIKNSDDLLLAGAKHGFATFNPSSGELVSFRSYFEDEASIADAWKFRANDGAIDAKGRIIQGIMIDDKIEPPTAVGMLLSFDLDGRINRLVDNVTCPNGLGWNAANTIMYWAESKSGNVYAFDYDLDTGAVTGQRVFFNLEPTGSNVNVPDGLVVDEQDHIWLAVWGGSSVLRISPDGVVVGKIELPTRFVTCPAFVGTDLFITTAAERDPESHARSALLGGHLFKCNVGVKGLPKFESQPLSSYKP